MGWLGMDSTLLHVALIPGCLLKKQRLPGEYSSNGSIQECQRVGRELAETVMSLKVSAQNKYIVPSAIFHSPR